MWTREIFSKKQCVYNKRRGLYSKTTEMSLYEIKLRIK